MNVYLLLATLNLCLGGLVFLLGLVIFRENPGQRLNRLVALMLFFGGFGAVVAAVALLAGRSATSAVGGQAVSDLLQNVAYVWEFYFPTLFMFASIFPTERGYARRSWRIPLLPWQPGFGVLVFAPHLFHFALTAVITNWHPAIALPKLGALQYLRPAFDLVGVVTRLFLFVHQALFSLVDLGFGVATVVLLFDSIRRTTVPRLRQQLRVVAIGLTASLVCYSLTTSLPGLFNYKLADSVKAALTIVALTLGPGSIAYSVVRYKFLDARLLARRGILYALASAALVGVYLVVASRLQGFMTQMFRADARVFEPVFLIVALALFQPAIAQLEQMLDQMFLRDPADYRNVIRQLGRDLQTTIDLDELLGRTVHTLSDAMLLKSALVVALTRQGPVARVAGGRTLTDAELRWLATMLPRVGAEQATWRMSDHVEGLDAEEQRVLASELGVSLLVPLRWHGEMVGAMLLGDKITGVNHTSEDETLLANLAGQLSVSLQNALLLRDRVSVARFEEELNLARQIQRTSLLSVFPELQGLEVHAVFRPSKHVGGDFYDVVDAGDGTFLIAIADVSGKGVPAALLSSMLQASLRTQAATAGLGDILRSINTLLYRSSSIRQFATFFLARINPATRSLEFSNAGHNWPIVSRAMGGRALLDRGGTVLGILEGARFEEDRLTLSPGDRLVCYTDGVTEAANADRDQFGEERLYELIESMPRDLGAAEIAERILAGLAVHLGDQEPQDDITVLVLRALEPVGVGEDGETQREAVAVV
jgi:serine phosphatase RsbU (regulator of sigma subunit)